MSLVLLDEVEKPRVSGEYYIHTLYPHFKFEVSGLDSGY